MGWFCSAGVFCFVCKFVNLWNAAFLSSMVKCYPSFLLYHSFLIFFYPHCFPHIPLYCLHDATLLSIQRNTCWRSCQRHKAFKVSINTTWSICHALHFNLLKKKTKTSPGEIVIFRKMPHPVIIVSFKIKGRNPGLILSILLNSLPIYNCQQHGVIDPPNNSPTSVFTLMELTF